MIIDAHWHVLYLLIIFDFPEIPQTHLAAHVPTICILPFAAAGWKRFLRSLHFHLGTTSVADITLIQVHHDAVVRIFAHGFASWAGFHVGKADLQNWQVSHLPGSFHQVHNLRRQSRRCFLLSCRK